MSKEPTADHHPRAGDADRLMIRGGKRKAVRREQRIAANRKRSGNPHPSKGKPFEPGDPRINRAGVPDESLKFQQRLREAFAAELGKASELDPEGKQTKFERIVERIVLMAEGGCPWAAEMIWDRIGGKPIQPHEVGGVDGEPIKHVIEFAK